jgi:hypothetical protein
MSASKIGSMTVFRAVCTMRSRTVGIESGRSSSRPDFGMKTRRAKRTPAPVLEIRGQLVEQAAHAVALDVGDGGSVDAGRAATPRASADPKAGRKVGSC